MVANYVVILSYIKQNYPLSTVIVNSLFPPPKRREYLLPNTLDFNERLERLTAEYGYIFLDNYSALSDEEGLIKREYGAAHLNRAGYEVWYGLLGDVM